GLRLWLLLQAAEPPGASPWEHWLDRLPKDLAAGAGCLPLALAEEASLLALHGTSLPSCAEALQRRLRSEWEDLKLFAGSSNPELRALADCPWERYVWAQAVLSTRSFTIPVEGQGPLCCLLPVVDFANHDGKPNARVAHTPRGVELVALRDLESGEEILVSYGDHTADQFVFAFGFLPADAPLTELP
ncbi:unnamed protein product, partial [Polarella glacialis]